MLCVNSLFLWLLFYFFIFLVSSSSFDSHRISFGSWSVYETHRFKWFVLTCSALLWEREDLVVVGYYHSHVQEDTSIIFLTIPLLHLLRDAWSFFFWDWNVGRKEREREKRQRRFLEEIPTDDEKIVTIAKTRKPVLRKLIIHQGSLPNMSINAFHPNRTEKDQFHVFMLIKHEREGEKKKLIKFWLIYSRGKQN